MSVSYEINQQKIILNEPYAIVLLPNYTVVRYGEKDVMEKEYDAIIEKIKAYDDEPSENLLTKKVLGILKDYNFNIPMPTKEDVKELINDYMLLSLPNNQEEFEKIIYNTGYLKTYFK